MRKESNTSTCESGKGMLNLIPAIREIKVQISNIKAKHAAELKPYIDSLENLQQINQACELCGGKGEIFHRACAEDEGDCIRCKQCSGTGVKKHDQNISSSEK